MQFKFFKLGLSGSIFLYILYSSELEVILIGGQDEDFPSPSSLVEIYSIEEGFIAKLPSMPTAR